MFHVCMIKRIKEGRHISTYSSYIYIHILYLNVSYLHKNKQSSYQNLYQISSKRDYLARNKNKLIIFSANHPTLYLSSLIIKLHFLHGPQYFLSLSPRRRNLYIERASLLLESQKGAISKVRVSLSNHQS